jgi:hypothetical protein
VLGVLLRKDISEAAAGRPRKASVRYVAVTLLHFQKSPSLVNVPQGLDVNRPPPPMNWGVREQGSPTRASFRTAQAASPKSALASAPGRKALKEVLGSSCNWGILNSSGNAEDGMEVVVEHPQTKVERIKVERFCSARRNSMCLEAQQGNRRAEQ